MSLPSSFTLKNASPPIAIPSRGLGTFQAERRAYPPGSVKESVLSALRLGYRHIDTGLGYNSGQTEKDVGDAVRESGLAREDIFIVTKLHNTYHAAKDVKIGLESSLKNLAMDYVDLYLMHFPYAYLCGENYSTIRRPDGSGKPVMDIALSKDYTGTWRAMQELLSTRKVKSIGVSNFNILKLKRLIEETGFVPAANQIEFNPYFPQKALHEFCKSYNIQVIAHCPLGGAPIPALACRKGPGPLDDLLIQRIAVSHQRTVAQVILAWIISQGVCAIPKSNSPLRIAENFDVLFKLTEDEERMIGELMGERGELAVRNIATKDYVGFDIYDETIDQPE